MLEPAERGIKPGYEQKYFSPEDKRGKLRLVASPDGRDGSVTVNQDAYLYATLVDGAESVSHQLAGDRKAYVQIARGSATVNGRPLRAGDALRIDGESNVEIRDGSNAEVLLFDLN